MLQGPGHLATERPQSNSLQCYKINTLIDLNHDEKNYKKNFKISGI